jgi:hypothetical protein
VHRPDELQPVGARQNTRQEESHRCRDPQTMADDGQGKDDQDVIEDDNFHGPSTLVAACTPKPLSARKGRRLRYRLEPTLYVTNPD